MLDSFRSLLDHLVIKILLGVLILSFGVWGIGDMLRTTGRNQPVAMVGGASISPADFQNELKQETAQIRGMLGAQATPEMIQQLNLPAHALQKLVNQKLIGLESEALGLVPSDADVAKRIRENEQFHDDKGQFSKQRFEAVLNNSHMSEKNYVARLREDMASALLQDALSSAVPTSGVALDRAALTLYDVRQEQRSASFYTLTTALVANVAQPDAKQVEAWYKANGTQFTAPEYRNVSYITLTAADAQKQVTVTDDELRAAYKERIEEFKHPERRSVEQLLYTSEEDANKATAMLKTGKSFAQVAEATDAVNKASLSLGKVTSANMMEGTGEAVFALPLNGVTPPIKTPFGFNIFHVTAIDAPSTDTFEQAKPALEKDAKQHAAEEALNSYTNKLQDALAGGSTLQEVARDFKLPLHTVGTVDHQGLSPDGAKNKDVPELDKLLETAFKTEEKTESNLIAAKGGVSYILRVESVKPEQLRPLDSVKAQVVSGWQKEQREKQLGEMAQEIAKKFKGATRAAVIAQYGLQPTVTATVKHTSQTAGVLALPPGLITDLFERKSGDSTQAYPMPNGGYMVAVLDSVITAPSPNSDAKLKTALADSKNDVTRDIRTELSEEYIRYLITKYGVSVNDAAVQSIVK